MLAAGGEFALPRRATDSVGPSRPVDLRDTPLPPVIADRVAAVERDAYAAGHADGVREGDAAAAARIDALVRRLEQTISEVAGLRTVMVRRTEREIVRLAIAIAERIVHREVSVDRDLMLTMARIAIDRLGDHAAATIHLNPADFDAVSANGDPAPHGGAVKMVADHQVTRGGCLIRSAFGVIDASIDSQVREIARGLLGDGPVDPDPHGHASPR